MHLLHHPGSCYPTELRPSSPDAVSKLLIPFAYVHEVMSSKRIWIVSSPLSICFPSNRKTWFPRGRMVRLCRWRNLTSLCNLVDTHRSIDHSLCQVHRSSSSCQPQLCNTQSQLISPDLWILAHSSKFRHKAPTDRLSACDLEPVWTWTPWSQPEHW